MARRCRRLALTAIVALGILLIATRLRSRCAAVASAGDAGSDDGPPWRDPVDGRCPAGFPVKVSRSGIYHLVGGRSYDRTAPERCYATADAAEADGYRRAKA